MSQQEARFIDPPNILRQKVGYGGIDPLIVDRAEQFIDTNELDFGPFALQLMKTLNDLVKDCKAGRRKGKEAVDALTRPIMELKANGGMFKYMLVSEIADIVLNFLENIDDLNDDVHDIIAAHQNALSVIVMNRLQGGGGREGRALAEELYGACKRYYKKYDIVLRG